MAVKYYCDCCKDEIENRHYSFNYLVHIKETLQGKIGFVDTISMQPVSGREEILELCLKCYNSIMYAACEKFEKIKKGD